MTGNKVLEEFRANRFDSLAEDARVYLILTRPSAVRRAGIEYPPGHLETARKVLKRLASCYRVG